jgi:hypothetical protein
MAIIGTVQSRIDMHCAPITTAQRKKQRIRLTNGGQQRSAMTSDRRADSLFDACAAPASASTARRSRDFRCIEETPVAQRLLFTSRQLPHVCARASGDANAWRDDAMKRSTAFRAARKKIFHRRVARARHGAKNAGEGANQCR